MKIPHHEIPLLKPLIIFILGTIAAEHFLTSMRISSLLVYFILGFLVLLIFSKRINNLITSFSVLIIFFGLGFTNLQERGLGNSTALFAEKQTIITVRIDKILAHTKHKKCFVEILSYMNDRGELSSSKGKLLVYFKDLAIDTSITLGNEYLIKGKAFQVQSSLNPHTFDYAEYLGRENIHHQLYVDESQFSLLRKNQNSHIDRIVHSIRNRCLSIFKKYFSDQDKLGILHAMVLGKRDSLSKELNQSFIDTGAIHVLAVSGLHVGILCLFVTGLFKLFETLFRFSKFTRGVISVFIIWFFALLTGASPAVCRAAMMFTLFYVAKDVLHRKVSIYNVLCGTAFILLVINPSQLFQIGFQFSFLAVFSIVFFYPYVNSIFNSKYKAINYLYSSVSIGIAAQILVFPLGIFYFNKFANSFLITSLFVVQFAMVILIGGLAILIFEIIGLSVINQFILVPCLDFILEKFQWLIAIVQELPLSSSSNLWLDQIQLILMYLCLVSFMYYLKQGRIYLYICLAIFFCLINYSLHERIAKGTQQVAYIYEAQEPCMDVFIGRSALYLGSDLTSEADFIYSKNRLAHSINRVLQVEENSSGKGFEYQNGLVRLGNKVLAFANVEVMNSIKKDQHIDYVLVNKENVELERLDLDQLKGVEIILDGSLKFWVREKLLTFVQANGLKVYDVKTEGAKEVIF